MFRLDPIGQLDWKPYQCPTLAPIFCQLLGKNVYMVRKYVRSDYPIDPACTTPNDPSWLFHPCGPASQDDIVETDRRIGETAYFPNLVGRPTYERLSRIERVLRWTTGNYPHFLSPWTPSSTDDLTRVDDQIVEATVGFIASDCGRIPSSDIRFVRRKKEKSHDIYIDASQCKSMIEVKHLLKFPQSVSERQWFDAVKRCKASLLNTALPPYDDLHSQVLHELENADSGYSVNRECFSFQKSEKSIRDQINKGESQLVNAPEGYCKILVIHTDDPYTLSSCGNLNRIESVVGAFLSEPSKSSDAIVILGNHLGFPIVHGYSCKILSKGQVPDVARRLFGSLTPLDAIDARPCILGIRADLPPSGSLSTTSGF